MKFLKALDSIAADVLNGAAALTGGAIDIATAGTVTLAKALRDPAEKPDPTTQKKRG
jgi:hypothetical protein